MTEHIIISKTQNNQCIQNSRSACHGMPKVPVCMPDIAKRDKISLNFVILGPVVQSIVSLTSSLRGQLVKCFTTLLLNTLISLLKKIAKASHIFFNKKYGCISCIKV